MGILLLTVVLFALCAPTVVLLLLSRRSDRPLQFSLRALFGTLTLVALILGGLGWWRMANLAQVRWLDPAAPEAISLLRTPQIVMDADGEWLAVYESRCRPIHDLGQTLESDAVRIQGDHSTRWDQQTARLKIRGNDRASMEAYLAALNAADTPSPRQIVIRGRIEDADGEPVAGATVDLMGPYVYINHFQTRDDGTFVMPITPNQGWGYYLRIRPRDGERRNTGQFSLSYDEPERVAIVRLP